mmetsp:Transcript_86877/g.194664  ORF Transcript_86877/g.194664 Transcript_86877/m.194664 type:complete len:204 (+) Transcript_86877:130-741(+)
MWSCCNCAHEDHDESQQTIYDPVVGTNRTGEELATLLSTPRRGDVAAMSPDEKLQEKARLQELVRGFARRAVRGINCQLVDVATGRASPAAYELDRQLRVLRVTPKDPSLPVQAGRIALIRDAYGAEAPESWVPPAARAALSEEQRARMALLSFEDAPMVCLLESSPAEKERLVTCMKILRVYAQTDGASTAPATMAVPRPQY